MHGIVHDRSLFSSRAEFERQLPLIRDLAERLGAVGFRSPATHRVDRLARRAAGRVRRHDPPLRPVRAAAGRLLQPLAVLRRRRRRAPVHAPAGSHAADAARAPHAEAVDRDAAAAIVARHGLIHCLSHPDPGYLGDPDKRAIYREFLVGMARARRGLARAAARGRALVARAGRRHGGGSLRRTGGPESPTTRSASRCSPAETAQARAGSTARSGSAARSSGTCRWRSSNSTLSSPSSRRATTSDRKNRSMRARTTRSSVTAK